MAYRSRTPAGRRGGSSRSGNPAATAIAIVLVLGVIGLVIFLSANKDKKPAPPPVPPAAPPVVETRPTPPKPPSPPPFPPMSAEKIAEIKAEVKALNVQETAKQAQVLYDEAMTAKNAGDEATWQAKLREAATKLEPINDQWNEIVATLPSTKDYTEDEVANHYFGEEATAVNKALNLLPGIKKQIRLR